MQPVKNIVPLPPKTVMSGSSPKCNPAEATFTFSVSPQNPVFPFVLSDLHFLGH